MRTLMVLVVAMTLVACGSSSNDGARSRPPVALEHIHALAVNPADGALFAAAHNGLFRVARSGSRLRPVPGSERDTMGLAAVGPNRFLASGHTPDTASSLGLIGSSDAGRSWRPLVLAGRADLHVIRTGRRVFYAHDAAGNRLFEGARSGTGLSVRTTPPGTTFDLAVDPRHDSRVFATTDRGFYLSENGGRRWHRIDRTRTGLMTFRGSVLTMVDGQGRVSALRRLGRPWRFVGVLPERIAALTAGLNGRLYAALTDDSIVVSDDGGRIWRPRSSAA